VLTKRDREIVGWIGRHGAVQAQHVMTRFSIGRTAAYRRLHELVEYGLIRRHRLLYNDAGLLTATPAGLQWADMQRLTPARISLALLPHTIASAALAALLEPELTDQMLLSDREHRAAERAAARPLASAIMGSDRSDRGALHRPDLVLIGAGGEPMTAIEIELTLKTKARLEPILRGYLRNRNLASVRYYARPEIAKAVEQAARATGADAVLELAALPQAATPTIWRQR
jgi:hypothetical protein